MNKSEEDRARTILIQTAAEYCFTLKLENRTDGPHGVTFCQHRLDASKGVFVPNPVRVFNKLAAGPIKKDTEAQRSKFRQRKGAALLAYL